jgi:beta-glucosidase
MARIEFPPDFVWGAATSAYQIEGAVADDGRGESIWDRFCHTPGRVHDGHTADVATDHYHRWPQDVNLMAGLGIGGYRFSVAWPRVLPEGRGNVNSPGLGFYDRLVDALVNHGIEPFVTLYHWDLPQVLEDEGGWTNRATAEAFAEYAGLVVERLGDRVHHWLTINEPACVAELGHRIGTHAPGRSSMAEALAAAHHLLLAHGLAVERVRSITPESQVGIAIDVWPQHPASLHILDLEAASIAHDRLNHWYLDPIAGLGYPAQTAARAGWQQEEVEPGDLDIVAVPIDYLGINYYSRAIVASDALPDEQRPDPIRPSAAVTDMLWEIYPSGLTEVLEWSHRRYGFPAIYITENGVASDDRSGPPFVDNDRISYMRQHIAAAHLAMSRGVPLRGYFAWSLFDNFEWERGYAMRFGLVRIDYETLERTVRESGRWYARVAATGALEV